MTTTTTTQPAAAAIVLTEQQKLALDKMWVFLKSFEKFFLLSGYAGTGKSTCIFILISYLLSEGKRIALCAPTNKAVEVLRRNARRQNITGVEFFTVYQLLGLGVVTQSGEKVVKQTGTSYLHMYDTVFVDEGSMISKKLWLCVEEAANQLVNRTKFIFMADSAQLNPVGERRSLVFKIKTKAGLTQVCRQGKDNPLQEYLLDVRRCIKVNSRVRPFNLTSEDGKTGVKLTSCKAILKYACSTFKAKFNRNPDHIRVLCWSNARVDWYNTKIRRSLYGSNAPRFVSGERLIARSPVLAPDGKTIVLTTSTEFNVKEVHEDFYNSYRAWRLVIQLDDGSIRQIFVLHEAEETRFNQEVDRLKQNAQRNPSLWKRYYEQMEKFAQVRNCYALTIHNSQGSTYTEVIIDAIDVQRRLKVSDDRPADRLAEFNRLHYVAASRATDRTLVVTS